ncbi:MAG: hypothetical protein ACKVT0_17230 [Planctomycetaceae bacterium]
MSRSGRLSSLCLLMVWVCLLVTGCGEPAAPPIPEPGSDAKSALDYVNKTQMGQMLGTNAARYKPDSAKDLGGGKFEMEDTEGKKYTVTVTSEGSTYKMGTPEPVK